ncbi:hypothetical protein BUALT_Bualt14G0055900 [Buddleja alternifolia]|uniref:NB-ARC domain-containing protein n=1 Tax=Buddleja alternifolia TaxID=168488 RepID=A0AAV6WPS8_9LAMI|nr:hypothetical protein BUALT_Bualt14G0055900 [Buddleja alternifolia]
MAAGFLLESVEERLRDSFILEKDLKERIDKIEKELPLWRSHLNDAEMRQAGDGRIYLGREVREIIYRFENVRENFTIVAASRRGFSKKIVCVGVTDLREIAREIKDINDKIENLNETRKRFISSTPAPESGSGSSSTYLRFDLVEEEPFFGRSEEIELLRSYITDPNSQRRVISIFGMGGLGKTALARQLYSDIRVQQHFDSVAWVTVSRFQRSEILKDLYQQLNPQHGKESISDMSDGDLGRRLYEIQQESKCLIFLDDVCSSNAWQNLRFAFPSVNTRSKILITTRVMEVADAVEIVTAKRYIHKLRCLTEAEGCDLLMDSLRSRNVPVLHENMYMSCISKQIDLIPLCMRLNLVIFLHLCDVSLQFILAEFEANRTVSETGKEMVKCCEGLPVAIISFIEYMVSKHTLEEWKSVHQNFESFVSESQKIRRLERLALSYDNLPPFLKPCFLYLGYLQEHSQIDAEKLYLLWVAEGLISLEDCGKEEILMNVAERYLIDLARRSMIEVHEEEVATITRFSSFRLNRMMRELSLRRSKEEGFFKAVNFGCGSPQDSGREEILMNVAERYSNDLAGRNMNEVHEEEVPPTTRFISHMVNWINKELFLRENEEVTLSASSSSRNQTYRLSINLDKYESRYGFPVDDAEKKEIRCLLLSAKENEPGLVWPNELSSLVKFKYLRVLDFIGFSFQDTELPDGIGKLVFLRYLSFRGCILPKLPSSIGKLKVLDVLDLRVINKMTIPDVLWKLKKLKHLCLPQSFETQDAGKLRLDGLTELETVTNLNTKMLNVRDLSKSPNLRYIALNIQGSLEDIECIIRRMNANTDVHLLRASVEVRYFDCYTEERHYVFRQLLGCHSLIDFCIEGQICRLPPHDGISRNLAKIVLIGSELMDDPMKTLEKLPKLRVLVLKNDAFVGKTMTCSETGFIELKRLQLLNMQYLEKWTVEEGAMPKLSTLEIVNCGKLIMLPKELNFFVISSMKKSGMCEEFEDSFNRRVDGKMKDKEQNVPSITFEG